MCPPSSSLEPANPSPPPPSKPPSWVPADPLSQSAYTYAHQHLHPDILSHSARVYHYAHTLATREKNNPWSQPERLPLLFTAALFHDIGTSSTHDGPQRFEVEGADAAVSHLKTFGEGKVSESDCQSVWIAIALHTSPGIAERIEPLARLVRVGVAVDFGVGDARGMISEGKIAEVEGLLPRGQVEKVLGVAVVEQALRRPETKGLRGTWVGDLARAYREDEGWEGVNRAF